MEDWNAAQYLRFEEERTRPARDLLARVPLEAPSRCVDLGCGPGNSTELIVGRYPASQVTGLDASPEMLASARARLPGLQFEQADIAAWSPGRLYDLVFANAVLQWLPDHRSLLARLMDALAPGGWLAVQMPDNLDEPSHAAMRHVALQEPWREALQEVGASRTSIASIETYYGWLASAGFQGIDIWQTTYVHVLDGAEAIVEWIKGTGLRPFLAPLDDPRRADYLAAYGRAVEMGYPRQADGRVLLRFPRLFMVAQAPR